MTDKRKLLRVAAYIRVSTENGSQEDSFETQERYFGQLLQENDGWISAGIYADYGLSATSEQKRTGFKRLLRHCEDGRIDRILCKSISRFSRNTRDFVAALRVMKDNDVTIYFEKEGLDTGDANNEFVLTALGAVAQEESRSISENIRWGYARRYPRGEARNFAIYGYRYAEGAQSIQSTDSGYRFRRIQTVEEEARVVRRIFQEAANGDSYVEIARKLNGDHIPPPENVWTKRHKRMREGLPPAKGEIRDEIDQGWTSEQIGRMLNLERYTGDILLKKSYKQDFKDHHARRNKGEQPQYLIRDHHPAIIPRPLYEQVQQQRSIRSQERHCQSRGRIRYPLSGRLVCANCGRFFHTRNRKSRPIWFCPSGALNNGKQVCGARGIYEEQIEGMLRQAFIKRFSRDSPKELPAQMLEKLKQVQYQDTMERDRAYLKGRIERADREDDSATAEALRQKLEAMEAYWEELEADYEERRKAIFWLEEIIRQGIWKAFIKGAAGEYVKAFVLSVTVYSPAHYRVRWFDDTVTEVESAFFGEIKQID